MTITDTITYPTWSLNNTIDEAIVYKTKEIEF